MMMVVHGTSHLICLSKRDLNVVRGRREKLSSRWHLERRIAEEQFSRGVAVGERSDGARGGIASSHVAPSTRSTLITLLGLPPPGATSTLSLSKTSSWEREGEKHRGQGGRSLLARHRERLAWYTSIPLVNGNRHVIFQRRERVSPSFSSGK